MIPIGAKVPAGLDTSGGRGAVAPVAVAAEMMRVVVALEETVLLDDPGDLGPHIGPQNARGEFRMIVRRQIIAHVVNERSDDELVVRPVPPGTRRGLQRMFQARHAITAEPGLQRARASS